MTRFLLLAFLLFFQTLCFGKHIIGGVLTYECLGNGDYRFTMKMYRDCNDPTGAFFDSPAAFSIYKGNSQNDLETLFIDLESYASIEPEDNPCLELPPNVCVQEGIYVFEYHFDEWPSADSYHISYQRCCRNATITNIQTPGDVGATFTVEITPASQAVCNNSPVYNTFPPIVICVNEPLNYDHSAFDAEGDQLFYAFCSPLVGGGMGGGGGNGCNAIQPVPACPPPYQTVNFVNPPYSPLNPMGGSPTVAINTITGALSGTPTVQGQFSVAVCVKEYRNGVLLGETRRDFQFNVANCQALIQAEIDAEDLELIDQNYFLKTCDGTTISLDNQSTQSADIQDWQWELEIDDTLAIVDTWDLNYTFPEAGSYNGRLVLNPGFGCGDTANITIEIYPKLTAAFDYQYDTCVAGPVSFFNQSFIDGAGQIAFFKWNLGDGTLDSVRNNPVHLYDEPKVVPVKLTVTDEHGCQDDTARAVIYKPVPALILVRPNDTLSCPPASVFFNNLSNPIDLSYDIRWDFGDSLTSDEISPTHTYLQPGIYDVHLQITSPIGCHVDTLFNDLIQIFPPPVAGFSFDPPVVSNFNPEISFTDESLNTVHWDWYVNDKLVSQEQNFTYSFPDTGLQKVTQVVVHPEKCVDSLTQFVDVEPKVTFFMPTAFSPNEDTVNELFRGNGFTRGVTNFKLEIWNRWGEKIFETSDPAEAWNGRVNNADRAAQPGVYICLVSFTEPRGKSFEYKGYATLIR